MFISHLCCTDFFFLISSVNMEISDAEQRAGERFVSVVEIYCLRDWSRAVGTPAGCCGQHTYFLHIRSEADELLEGQKKCRSISPQQIMEQAVLQGKDLTFEEFCINLAES